jgi:2-keto-3-deoxy-L-rhamnonate aldolase RhmA
MSFTVSNPWRDRILRGEVCSVMSVKYAISNEITMMTKMAGMDGMFIDMEHSVLTIREVSQLVTACNYVGVSPIVRIPSKAHWHLSRILDAGAAAVVIPHCETVDQVQEIVKDAKYAPLGRRGCAGNQPILNFQAVPTLVQNDLLNRETMVIPMIETPGAVELADEFLAIPGVDGILVGSNDLCTDLEIPGQYDNPVYLDSVTKVVKAGVRAGKPIGVGGIGGRLDLLEKFFEMGASWSLSGADGAMLQAGMKALGSKYSEINKRVQATRAMQAVSNSDAPRSTIESTVATEGVDIARTQDTTKQPQAVVSEVVAQTA